MQTTADMRECMARDAAAAGDGLNALESELSQLHPSGSTELDRVAELYREYRDAQCQWERDAIYGNGSMERVLSGRSTRFHVAKDATFNAWKMCGSSCIAKSLSK